MWKEKIQCDKVRQLEILFGILSKLVNTYIICSLDGQSQAAVRQSFKLNLEVDVKAESHHDRYFYFHFVFLGGFTCLICSLDEQELFVEFHPKLTTNRSWWMSQRATLKT